AYALENWSSGKQENLLPRLSELTLPVLLLAGEQDSKYSAINQQMHSRLTGNSTNIVIQNAGHAAQLEQPELTAEYIRSFLS
ncbi:2-succinyl-6-hydroxy-2,4-cyclohexadiene-1-carboxylate synthase, partial [bacterium]|nr:2-succinyl-6-hydroxy-2,4-cyclohexadiene-1-carboxylate synthase [bacterium]